MLKEKLPYKDSDDLFYKLEKAIEVVQEEELGNMQFYRDLVDLKEIAREYTILEALFEDFEDDERPQNVRKGLKDSRMYLTLSMNNFKVSIERMLEIFEAFVAMEM